MPGTKGKWRYARPKGNGDMQDQREMEIFKQELKCVTYPRSNNGY